MHSYLKGHIWQAMPDRNLIILPSENQTREFDAKLLLACVLAERGHEVVIGARHYIHNRIADFEPGIYLAKDFRKPSERILALIAGLGHHIVAWDEEGLVQPDAQLYYDRRYSNKAISHVRSVFAWGPANRRLMEEAPHWPKLPIHDTGNPRLDLLRSELRGFHTAEVERLKTHYGQFVLFDSNFASFNSAIRNATPVLFDRNGVLSQYLQGRKRLFERWQKVLPKLAKAIAPSIVIIRPHPAESHAAWQRVAELSDNIKVVHEGSALAWILAADVMLHSGCTTGVEAALMGRTAIAFRPDDVPGLEKDLPDKLSTLVQHEAALINQVQQELSLGNAKALSREQRSMIVDAAFSQSGALASDHIANILDTLKSEGKKQFGAQLKARARQLEKLLMGLNPNHKSSAAINALRYPGVTSGQVGEKISTLQITLNRFKTVKFGSLHKDIYVLRG